jgi:uncharacterized membrane protein
MNHAVAPLAVLRATRALAVGATLALIALGLAWELRLAPTGSGTLAIKVLPLLLPLAGLMRMRLYTYRWTSLLVWLYVAEGAVRATSDRGVGALLASAEIALALVLFVACAVHIRARLRADAASLATARATAS